MRSALGIGTVHHAPSQFAIAVNCETEAGATGVAYERFTPEGPLALLPIPNTSSTRARYNVIWCAHQERQAELMALSDEGFIEALQAEFGWRAGKIARLAAAQAGRLGVWLLESSFDRVAYYWEIRAHVTPGGWTGVQFIASGRRSPCDADLS